MYFKNKGHNVVATHPLAFHLSDSIAKIMPDENGQHERGVDVETHCRIVGLVASELLSRMPSVIRGSLFPTGAELIAAVHDVGKVNPLFQEKIRRLLKDYPKNSFPGLESAKPELEESSGHHSGASQAALQAISPVIAKIAGSHHGQSPNMNILLADDQIFGGPQWQRLRIELVEELKSFFQCDWPVVSDTLHRLVLSGLTTVADWIGSGPVFDMLKELNTAKTAQLVREAVDLAGFIPPKVQKGLRFEDIFKSYSPRPIQTALIQMVDRPGVYILEALMGEGKTEAALFAAYKMLASGQATGIYFALPTQITSEKIFERMNGFLKAILEPEDKHRSLLLHGNAWMFETALGEDARPGYSWFDARKRGLLAPFGVGTIDQAIMSVMHVKHGFVRAFGLMGKVVILDEVHSYDAYTGTIMDHLIETLVGLRCTVILLSATLTKDRKDHMLDSSNPTQAESIVSRYPLVTKALPNSESEFSSEITSIPQAIEIVHSNDDEKARFLVMDIASRGGLVLWLENTVQEAQDTFKKFAAWGKNHSIEVGLLHSRFPAIRRSELENTWVTAYGKDGISSRRLTPRILVGTQVLEQSLDIDADFLVTRIAPTDMLLQRIGRLWRHRDADPMRPDGLKRTAMILSPDLEAAASSPLWAFGPSGKVYAPYVLVRSLEIWSQLNCLSIPNDMRGLIESTYSPRIEIGAIAAAKKELDHVREVLKREAGNSLIEAGGVRSDNARTRYSDMATCEVLLVKQEVDGASFIVLLDGEVVKLPKPAVLNLQERKRIAGILMKHTISVPVYIAPAPMSQQELHWLKPYLYVSDNEDERVRVAIIEPSGKISGFSGRLVQEKYDLEYSPVLGYVAYKKEGA